jgi:hypothetical protein
MKICYGCNEENDRQNDRYCNNCNKLYLQQQASLSPHLRIMDSNLVHRRKFRLCSCKQALKLVGKILCKKCSDINLKSIRLKNKVRQFTQYCVLIGVIEKPQHCELCKHPEIEAHHEDYFQPFKIRWLCKNHHAKEHVKLRLEKETS